MRRWTRNATMTWWCPVLGVGGRSTHHRGTTPSIIIPENRGFPDQVWGWSASRYRSSPTSLVPSRTGPESGVGWLGPAPRPLARTVRTVSNHSEFRRESAPRPMSEGFFFARAGLTRGRASQCNMRKSSIFPGDASGSDTASLSIVASRGRELGCTLTALAVLWER